MVLVEQFEEDVAVRSVGAAYGGDMAARRANLALTPYCEAFGYGNNKGIVYNSISFYYYLHIVITLLDLACRVTE